MARSKPSNPPRPPAGADQGVAVPRGARGAARPAGSAVSRRDPYADFLRSFSLMVVVLWHWCFTILRWNDDGPMALNPLGFTSGLWIFTWLLQVLPLFFFIGSYVHLLAWERAAARGDRIWTFALRQVRELGVPSAALLGTWVVLSIVVGSIFDISWFGRAVMLVVSPLWFVAVYLVLVALMPVTVWLHRRLDSVMLVLLGGMAVVVDILRFRYQVPYVEWANMIFVWGFAYQLGYFRSRLSDLDDPRPGGTGGTDWARQSPQARRTAWTMTLTGLFSLVGLVFSGLYPGSMVGVPGQGSNMAPPTVCIIALTVFQAGFAEVVRPSVVRALAAGGWFARVMTVITRFALPLFLFHTTGMALSRAVEWTVLGNRTAAIEPTLSWWLLRPVAIVGPLLATLPVIYLFSARHRRHETRRLASPPVVR